MKDLDTPQHEALRRFLKLECQKLELTQEEVARRVGRRQSFISAVESGQHRVEDGNVIVPPTRQYKDIEIRQLLAKRGVDGVLVVSVTGDTGVQQQYAGTIFSGNYSGMTSGSAMVVGNTISGSATSFGTMTATAAPVYRYSRTVAFQARLTDPKSGRNLWVGGGQTRAGGALFMADATSAHDAASAILKDLLEKGLIGGSGA
jgi:hypothetical protein